MTNTSTNTTVAPDKVNITGLGSGFIPTYNVIKILSEALKYSNVEISVKANCIEIYVLGEKLPGKRLVWAHHFSMLTTLIRRIQVQVLGKVMA